MPVETSIPADRFKILTEAATSVVGTAQLENLLRRLVETARTTTGARYAALGVVGDHDTLVEFVHVGISDEVVSAIGHLPTGKGVLGTLIREGKAIRLERIADHPDSVGFPEHHPPMETFLGVPVGTAEASFGRLYLADKEGGFTQADEAMVGALAAIAGAAVESVRLRSRLAQLAIIEDRERIGRDLHDSIIQDLFATGLELQGLSLMTEDSELAEALSGAVDRIDTTIDSLRRVISGLSRAGEVSGFEERLRAHTTQLARPYDVPILITVNPPELEIEGELHGQVIPLVGEAVSNALRHSGSSLVEVAVESLGDRLVISVTDQGSGFDVDTVERGMGLDNLEARAAQLGGDSTIRSVLGVGTVVEVVLPFTG